MKDPIVQTLVLEDVVAYAQKLGCYSVLSFEESDDLWIGQRLDLVVALACWFILSYREMRGA